MNLSATRPTERGVVRAGTVLPDYVGTRTDCGFLGGALLGLEPRSTKFMVQSSELLCLLTAHHLLRSNHAPHFSLITNSRQPHRKSRLIPLQRQRDTENVEQRDTKNVAAGHTRRESMAGRKVRAYRVSPLLPSHVALLASYLRYVSALTVHFSPSPLHPRPSLLTFHPPGCISVFCFLYSFPYLFTHYCLRFTTHYITFTTHFSLFTIH